MGQIVPCGEKHAIKTVLFAIEFGKPFEGSVIQNVIALHPKFSDFLPRKQEATAFVIQLDGPGGIPRPGTPPHPGGVTFDALTRVGTQEWALTIRDRAVTVTCNNYSKWVDIWPKAKELLLQVTPVILEKDVVTGIGLQYIDEFRWEGANQDFRLDLVFREDTDYLPRNVFRLKEPWHNHHGYFDQNSKPQHHKRLNNINIDVGVGEGIVIRTNILQRGLPDQPVANLVGEVDGYQDAMHEESKEILKSLVTEQVAKSIGLVD